MLQPVKIVALAAAMLLAAVLPGRAADTVTANDTARFLAGMAPSAESPLTPCYRPRKAKSEALLRALFGAPFWSTIRAPFRHRRNSVKSVKRKSPKVGFVSLGCPKALVDSERRVG